MTFVRWHYRNGVYVRSHYRHARRALGATQPMLLPRDPAGAAHDRAPRRWDATARRDGDRTRPQHPAPGQAQLMPAPGA